MTEPAGRMLETQARAAAKQQCTTWDGTLAHYLCLVTGHTGRPRHFLSRWRRRVWRCEDCGHQFITQYKVMGCISNGPLYDWVWVDVKDARA